MGDYSNIAQEWLSREDEVCREARLARLVWQAQRFPPSQVLLYHGGVSTKWLFEEARYCFVYGQYLAAIALGFAFVEQTLAAVLYGAGNDRAKRAKARDLFSEAVGQGLLSKEQVRLLHRARKIRNSLVHFRAPTEPTKLEIRALMREEHPYETLEGDARNVLDAAFFVLARVSMV